MPATSASDDRVKQWSVNGLTYTKMGLVVLFLWLLWGDFCFTLMEQVKPSILPLYLMGKAGGVNASNSLTNVLMYTIPGITGLILGPMISFKSDRHRGPNGRRIPYIIWTAPFLALAIIGIGFAPKYQAWFSGMGGWAGFSPRTLTLLLLGFFVVSFHCMDEFVNSVFWYLFADVVPEHFVGRFLGLFRMVGGGAVALFSYFVFPHAETHMPWIYLGAGLLYLGSFSLLCRRVKEGTYPPPDDLEGNPGVREQARIYLRECFGHKIYLMMYGYRFCLALALCTSAAAVIFQRDGIGLSMEDIGQVTAGIGILAMVLQYPSGAAVDRFHALRVSLFMLVPLVGIQIVSFFYLHDLRTFILLEGAKLVLLTLYGAAEIPMMITIFPKDKFGQFCSCNGLIKAVTMMLGAAVAGAFMDHMTANGTDKFAYRWMYVWSAVWQALAIIGIVGVYVIWQKRGGMAGYVAPGSLLERERLAAAAARAGN